MGEGSDSLTYAIRLPVVAKYVGQILVMFAVLTLAPLATSLWYQEYALSVRFVPVIVLVLIVSVPLARLRVTTSLQYNEALVIVALAFVLSPLLMTYPLMAVDLEFLDALFESVSAVTTTGLSVLPSVDTQPRTVLFTRAWMQWYGGLGFVVLSVALLIGHHPAARRLAETVAGENLVTTARIHARRTLVVYALLTLFGVAVVWPLVGDGFRAITHVLAAVSTGGFSTSDLSLAGIDNWSGRYAIVALAMLGAVPLILYYGAFRRRWDELGSDVELRALLAASLITIALLLALLALNAEAWTPTQFAQRILLGVSAQTTAGFSASAVSELDSPSKGVLILSMAIGGGTGSTAGGIKLLRIVILLRLIQLTLLRTAMPRHAVQQRTLGGRVLESDEIVRALILILLFAMVVFLSWLLFLLGGHDPLDALFEIVSATGTVGLSTGVTDTALQPVLKLVLCADMWLGRLEIVALLVLLYPSTWFGKRTQTT